jgi:hypothetical protein
MYHNTHYIQLQIQWSLKVWTHFTSSHTTQFCTTSFSYSFTSFHTHFTSFSYTFHLDSFHTHFISFSCTYHRTPCIRQQGSEASGKQGRQARGRHYRWGRPSAEATRCTIFSWSAIRRRLAGEGRAARLAGEGRTARLAGEGRMPPSEVQHGPRQSRPSDDRWRREGATTRPGRHGQARRLCSVRRLVAFGEGRTKVKKKWLQCASVCL